MLSFYTTDEKLPNDRVRVLIYLGGHYDSFLRSLKYVTGYIDCIGKGKGSWKGFVLDCGGREDLTSPILWAEIKPNKADLEKLHGTDLF